jgi:hypothetical protein
MKLIMILLALIATMTAGAKPTVNLEAFGSIGSPVTEEMMGATTQNSTAKTMYVSAATAAGMTGVNVGFRIKAVDEEGNPLNGNLHIGRILVVRSDNTRVQSSTVLSRYDLPDNDQKPNIWVENTEGDFRSGPAAVGVTINHSYITESIVSNAHTLLIGDYWIPYNNVNFPKLINQSDIAKIVFKIEGGTINGIPFETSEASVSVVLLDKPGLPANFGLSNAANGSIALSWTNRGDGSNYLIEESVDGLTWSTSVVSNNINTFTPSPSQRARQFRIRAQNPSGTSESSEVMEIPGTPVISLINGRIILKVGFISGINLAQVEVSADLVNWGPTPIGSDIYITNNQLTITLPRIDGSMYARVRSGPVPKK